MDFLATPILCLALNLYHEGRSESFNDQLAIAAITLNRVASSKYPNDICKVVTQTRKNNNRTVAQFSWYSDGKSDTPKNSVAYETAVDVAVYFLSNQETLMSGELVDLVDSTMYHADYASPFWSKSPKMKYVATYGSHLFYVGF